ncbi:MAG: barstar family protein [Bacteroidales bacterium]|nr:barstar family protein [Bacteroidales bacterium]
MKKIILDFSQSTSKEGMHKDLAEKFSFPSYYGANLDALYDMLTEISEPTCVGIFNYDRKYLKSVVEVFKDAENENQNLTVIFSELKDNG